MNGTPVSKNGELRYGPLGSSCVHICVDMQRLFAEPTEGQMPSWLNHPKQVRLPSKRRPSSSRSICLSDDEPGVADLLKYVPIRPPNRMETAETTNGL